MAMRLLGLVAMTVLLVLGARSCVSSGAGPALTGEFRQGVAGVCADAAAVSGANDAGSATPVTLVSGSQATRVGGMTKLAGLGSVALTCPTTTTTSFP